MLLPEHWNLYRKSYTLQQVFSEMKAIAHSAGKDSQKAKKDSVHMVLLISSFRLEVPTLEISAKSFHGSIVVAFSAS